MTKTQEQPEAKASQKAKRKSKPRQTKTDTLALCAQAIRDAREDMEFFYEWAMGDYPSSPKSIAQMKKEANTYLKPKLSNFLTIEHQLAKGRKEIQISKKFLDGIDWKLAEVRGYLEYLHSVSTTDTGYECSQAIVDSIS